jgi:YD repeat-containing protein
MKKILYIPVCLLLLLSASALAQNTTVHFGYDANGNRISRILEIRRIQSDDFLAGEDNMDLVPTLDGQRETWGGLHVSVYPNPTQSRFTIRQSGTATLPIEASLYTANGILIEQRILSDMNEEFNLGERSAGVYFLQLSSEQEKQTWKVVKR